jgi:hypothetical protein
MLEKIQQKIAIIKEIEFVDWDLLWEN